MEGIEAIGADIDPDSPTPLTGDLIECADAIFVMEDTHRARITRKFTPILKQKKIVVLGIPDHYEFMAPELVALLERKLEAYLWRA